MLICEEQQEDRTQAKRAVIVYLLREACEALESVEDLLSVELLLSDALDRLRAL